MASGAPSRHLAVGLMLFGPCSALLSARGSLGPVKFLRVARHAAHSRRGLRLKSTSAASTEAWPSAAGKALEVRLVAEEPELIRAHLKARGNDNAEMLASVEELGELNKERAALVQEGDKARADRKRLSAEIGGLLKAKSDDNNDAVAALKAEVEKANEVADAAASKVTALDESIAARLAKLPNLLADGVPSGLSEDDNEQVLEWGTEARKMGEGYAWHDEIAAGFNGYLSEEAAKLSGARFSVLAGPIAKLERALVQFFLDSAAEKGYTEYAVPFLVGRSVLEGTGQLPKFEDDLFKVNHQMNGEDSFLIPTAEVPLTNLFGGSILDVGNLPLKLVSCTPCFRAEAGSYGKDVRGLMRQHQFFKVEMVKVTAPEDSQAEHEALTQDAEDLLQALELPYRKMKLCAGDLGFSAQLCYDLEVWLPAQQAYREISSCSNCGDFQARRMGLRYRAKPVAAEEGEGDASKGKGKKKSGGGKGVVAHCHTINGSGLAVGRCVLAVLENYQLPDGSVAVPKVLQPYMGGLEVLVPPAKAK